MRAISIFSIVFLLAVLFLLVICVSGEETMSIPEQGIAPGTGRWITGPPEVDRTPVPYPTSQPIYRPTPQWTPVPYPTSQPIYRPTPQWTPVPYPTSQPIYRPTPQWTPTPCPTPQPIYRPTPQWTPTPYPTPQPIYNPAPDRTPVPYRPIDRDNSPNNPSYYLPYYPSGRYDQLQPLPRYDLGSDRLAPIAGGRNPCYPYGSCLRGALIIKSSPSGARIYLDNNYEGKTPLVLGSIPIGYHTLELTLSGYETYETDAKVYSNERTTISATLDPDSWTSGWFEITTNPAESAIYLDNIYQGTTSTNGFLKIQNLAAGFYTLNVTKSGFFTYSERTRIEAGSATVVNVALKDNYKTTSTTSSPKSEASENGTIKVTSTPPGAVILTDGNYQGFTPLTLTAVPGTYQISLQMQGYMNYNTPATISPGVDSEINVEMIPDKEEKTGQTGAAIPTPVNLVTLILGVFLATILCYRLR